MESNLRIKNVIMEEELVVSNVLLTKDITVLVIFMVKAPASLFVEIQSELLKKNVIMVTKKDVINVK